MQLKCGSCEGCWYKTNLLIPDNDNVKNGDCPCYKEFEVVVGRKITIQHWNTDVIVEGTIAGIGDGGLTITVDNKLIIDSDFVNVLYCASLNILTYMENGYMQLVKEKS